MYVKDLILKGSNLCVCACFYRDSGYCVDVKRKIDI